MKVMQLVVGPLATNCYLLVKDNQCLVVDPGDESQKIMATIDKQNLTVQGILLTHTHFDHVGALDDIKKNYMVDVYQKQNLPEGTKTIADFTFEVIYTPGHASDCITFYFEKEKIMMVGDFLFRGSIGRYDVPTSSYHDMKKSLAKIKTYDNDISIYPGHGETTTLDYEKKYNMYLKSF